MAIAYVVQLGGVDAARYEAVQKEVGFRDTKGDWPKGLISHLAGATPDGGWCVVDVWDSQADRDAFVESRLAPALQKIGGLPPPKITPVEVYNSDRRP
jgi:hypothetical protein